MGALAKTVTTLWALALLAWDGSPRGADAKVTILHDAHEGSHATCEAFAHLCVKTDCREIHDGTITGKRNIDWPYIESSEDELFLLRFPPRRASPKPFLNHSVIILVRENLFDWGLGTFHSQFAREPRASPGEPVFINGTKLLKVWERRVSHHDRCEVPPVQPRVQ